MWENKVMCLELICVKHPPMIGCTPYLCDRGVKKINNNVIFLLNFFCPKKTRLNCSSPSNKFPPPQWLVSIFRKILAKKVDARENTRVGENVVFQKRFFV